jgi:hypothetical protein
MRRLLACSLALLSVPVLAQKPWETKVDFPVPVPLELPAVPPTNPFAAPLVSPPAPVATPLREKFPDTFTVLAAIYVTGEGASRRVVFTRLPWPSLGNDLRQTVSELNFTPARASGAAVAVWVPLAIDLKGRVEQGRVARIQGSSPEPGTPPVPEATAVPTPDARDLELPATPLDRVDQMANPKRPPRIRADGRTWRQAVRLLAEVSPEGRCQRVVFLSCPEGLRGWLLASMAAWTFRPGAATTGPVTAWVQLDGEIEVEVGDLASESLRVTRQVTFPPAVAPAASGRPPGA